MFHYAGWQRCRSPYHLAPKEQGFRTCFFSFKNLSTFQHRWGVRMDIRGREVRGNGIICDYDEVPIKFLIRLDLPYPAHLFPQPTRLEPNTDTTSSANSGRRRFQVLLTLSVSRTTLKSGSVLVYAKFTGQVRNLCLNHDSGPVAHCSHYAGLYL